MDTILIHGLGQNSSSWNKMISYMDKQDNFICPDLSTFIKDDDVSYSQLYNNFSEYCDKFPEPLNLCGLSLGGVLALNYAIDNPQKIKSLVLIAAQYKMPKALLKLQNIIFRFIPEKTFKSMGMRKKDFIELTNSMMNLNFSEDLKNILCPVLLLCGEKDKPNKKATKQLANNIIDAEIQFINKTKHEVNIDSPKELAEIINAFYTHKILR